MSSSVIKTGQKSQLIQLYEPKVLPVPVREINFIGTTSGPHSWMSCLQVFLLHWLDFAIRYCIYSVGGALENTTSALYTFTTVSSYIFIYVPNLYIFVCRYHALSEYPHVRKLCNINSQYHDSKLRGRNNCGTLVMDTST